MAIAVGFSFFIAALGTAPARAADLPVVYSAAPALAATLAAPGTPPPGANDWSCRSETHPRPVILVHGTHANMTLNWNTLSPLLKNNGYCVFALNYGGLRGGQIGGTGDVRQSGRELADFTDRVLAATGADKVDFVGHSQGGMLPQYYVKFLGGAAHTGTIVGLAATSHGGTLSGAESLIDTLAIVFPPLVQAFGSLDPAALQQLPDSEFTRQLTSVPDTVPGVAYTMIASRYDEVVTPYRSAFLSGPGATNITLQDVCWNDFAEHLAMAYDHVALRLVLNALDPAHARQPSCAMPVWPLIGG